jgi:putative flippase GtrA
MDKSCPEIPACPDKNSTMGQQAMKYFFFAILMIILNILIQNVHEIWIIPFVQDNFGHINLVANYYLSTTPYNMPELIGSGLAVGITYIIKFFLDKFIVFEKKSTDFKKTSREFTIYLVLAILTTLENLGIQFLLGILTPLALNIRIIIALSCGYITKFFLDRKYCFMCI